MKTTDKELVVEKIQLSQLLDLISQIKNGLLTAIDAVNSAENQCIELKAPKKERLEKIL
jgi:hypothetical protein